MRSRTGQHSGRSAGELRPRRQRALDIRISRKKHGGTTFVVESPIPAGVHAAVVAPRPSASKLRFIHNGVADPVVWMPPVDTQHDVSAQGHRATGDEGGRKRPNVLCFRTEDSTWCFQPSSADIACEQLGIWNRICHQLRILPLWSTYRVPKHLSEGMASHLKTGLDLAPELFYPLDKRKLLSWNPIRETERYNWIPKSSALLTANLMMGCLFEDMRLGKTNSPTFSALNIAAYQVLNGMIATKERTQISGQLAAMIICQMALAANLCGKFDDWRIHVLGLQALMNNWCGWRNLDDCIGCNVIYLADFEGALAAGQSPILAFQRRFPLLKPTLAHGKLSSLRQGLETLTLAAHLPNVTGEILLSTCIFTHAILHAKDVNATYHPHRMSETFWGLNYELVLQPSPLFPDPRAQAVTDHSLETILMPTALGDPREVTASLDATVRIAALLFLREPMAEVVFSRSGYPQLLSLLAAHLTVLLTWMRGLAETNECLKTTELVQVKKVLKEAQDQQQWYTTTIPRLQAIRPFVVWTCVLGHLYAVRMGVHALYGRLFKDVIVELCGGVVSKLEEEDLALFQLLDMKYVAVGKWDLARTLQHMVSPRF